MEVIIVPTRSEIGRVAADAIAQLIVDDPRSVLGFATGSSPLEIYTDLTHRISAEGLDFSTATGFALDEYVGLPANHSQSYANVLRREVVEPLRMDPARVHIPDSRSDDLVAACRLYEEMIYAAGGIDIQILGIGSNGHIGFNEPTSSFASRTRVKTLTPETRAANARFFGNLNEVPTHCITQGLGTIIEARHVVLVAQGDRKADAVRAAIEGPVASMCPASILQHHPHVTFVLDELAAAHLKLGPYYRYAYENKLTSTGLR